MSPPQHAEVLRNQLPSPPQAEGAFAGALLRQPPLSSTVEVSASSQSPEQVVSPYTRLTAGPTSGRHLPDPRWASFSLPGIWNLNMGNLTKPVSPLSERLGQAV